MIFYLKKYSDPQFVMKKYYGKADATKKNMNPELQHIMLICEKIIK